MEVQPLGDCWIESVMRKKYWEVTQDSTRELRRRKEEMVLNGGELNTEDLSEEVQELPRRRNDGTVDVRNWVIASMAWQK